MQENKLFKSKLITLFTLISFTLCSCNGGGNSGSTNSNSNSKNNAANNLSLKSGGPIEIKYKEDIFNRAILDATTANNPLSLAGSIGINLAQASNNELFSFSESSYRPLSANLDSVARNRDQLLNDILSSVKVSGDKLELFNEQNKSGYDAYYQGVDALYLTYLKNTVFPSANINQVSLISQGAKNYCTSIGLSTIPLPMKTLNNKTNIAYAFQNITSRDNTVMDGFSNLRLKYKILPSILQPDMLDNGDQMVNINQYNAKIIGYYTQQIYFLKEMYSLQIMQAAMWNQRNSMCNFSDDNAPDFSNILNMPNLDGSDAALADAIAKITETYTNGIQKLIKSWKSDNGLITEAKMVQYLNKDIQTPTSQSPMLNENSFLPTPQNGLEIGRCTITSLKFDDKNNLLSTASQEDVINNRAGILYIGGTCISRDSFKTKNKNIVLKNYTMAFPYQLDTNSKIYDWANEIGFDFINEDKFSISKSSISSWQFRFNAANSLLNLTTEEKLIDTHIPLLRFADTLYEHYAWQDNDHLWYPGLIEFEPTSQAQFSYRVLNNSRALEHIGGDAQNIFPSSTPCINGCSLGEIKSRILRINGTRKELQPTIKNLGQKIGYKEIYIANSGDHIFGVRLIFTLTNEPTKGVHSSALHSDTPINQYVELICLTDTCKVDAPDFNKYSQTLNFYDGTQIKLNLSGKDQHFSDNQYSKVKFDSYNNGKYGTPSRFKWLLTSTYNPLNKNPAVSIPIAEQKLPADYSTWINNYNGNDNYMNAVLVIGGMALFAGVVITIAWLLSQHKSDPLNPTKIKPIEIAYSPNKNYRLIFDLNDFKLKIQSVNNSTAADLCYITAVPGATRVVFADGQAQIYQGRDLAWNNQLEYTKRGLQWVTDSFSKLAIDNSGVVTINPSNQNLGFKPQKATDKSNNVLWETYANGGSGSLCASSLDNATTKVEIEQNNGKMTNDEYNDFKPNSYTLSSTIDYSYPRDSLEDIPVGRYGLKTVLITNTSFQSLTLKEVKTDLNHTPNYLYISKDPRWTTCNLDGAMKLEAGKSCKVAYYFDPTLEGINLSFTVTAIMTANGIPAKGSSMYINAYSRIPLDKPKGDYLSKCTNITWLEGNLSGVCKPNAPRSSLQYFKQCKRNPLPTEVTVNNDGKLICVSPL